jgi:hypothetical protein
LKKILVDWVDSNFMHGWLEENTECDLAQVHNIGYLVSETDDKITLASGISAYGLMLNPITIPKGCIKSIIELRRKSVVSKNSKT